MSDFVWIIPAEKQLSLGEGGVSPNYIIPQGQMHGEERNLRGNRLWIILRGLEDRCIAVINVKKVEKFSEGYYANDFLISCDMAASFRLSSTFEEAKPYSLSDFQSQGPGILQIAEGSMNRLKSLVARTIQVKFTAPTDAILKRVKFDALFIKGEGLAKAALSQIVQAFPLDRIWAIGTGAKLGPFGNFASHLLTLHEYDSSVVTDFLRKVDPVYVLARAVRSPETSVEDTVLPTVTKNIDLDFTEIDPETVYAREFVSSNGMLSDLESALSKTEAAEKLHQAMLRDIASYLKEQGLSPYESASVDLMISLNGRRKIFEIKSSTSLNIIAQAAKGAFQIACYANAMAIDFEPLDTSLIMHKIQDAALEKFVYEALDRLGIKYLLYDPDTGWPNRVNGLLN